MNTRSSDCSNGLKRFLNRASLRATIPYIALVILVGVAVIVAGREIDRHISAIETWIANLGNWGYLAFLILFVLATTCFVPDTLMCMIAGALFDPVLGVAISTLGMLLAVALQYALSRRLLRERIEGIVASRPSLSAIQRAVIADEFRLQVLLRLTPLNPATVSYLLGGIGVGLLGFLVASLAAIPGLIVEVYFGYAGKHIARMAGGRDHAAYLHDLLIVVGLVTCAALVFVVSRMARNAVTEAVNKTANPPAHVP